MESLDLTYTLADLNAIFMPQVFKEHSHYYDKRKKIRK